jgi:hypothetical protein
LNLAFKQELLRDLFSKRQPKTSDLLGLKDIRGPPFSMRYFVFIAVRSMEGLQLKACDEHFLGVDPEGSLDRQGCVPIDRDRVLQRAEAVDRTEFVVKAFVEGFRP